MDNQADNRALRTIRKLNAIRRKQAQKIDILCNDMVDANKEVIEQLRILTSTVDFYESITGEMDITVLLEKGVRQVRKYVKDASVSIFLTNPGGFELHMADDNPIEFDGTKIETCFTDDLVNEICRSNKISSLEDMCNMGLQGNPNTLSSLSAAGVPLGRFSEPDGFIFIYRKSDKKLLPDELEKVAAITPGFRNAVRACQSITSGIVSK